MNGYVNHQLSRDIETSLFDSFITTPFRSSLDFKKVDDVTRNNRTVVVQSLAQCEYYSVRFDNVYSASLAPDFLRLAMSLPAVYNEEAYYELVRAYGTHVITGMSLGGRFGQQSTFYDLDYVDVIKSGSSIQRKAEYAAVVAAGYADRLTDAQLQEAHEFVTKAKDFTIWMEGGQFNPTVTEWMKTVRASPKPVRVELTSLDKLFSSIWMDPKIYPDVDIKRRNVQKMLSSYCDLLVQFGQVRTCEPFGEDRPVPK